jgi:thiopeptide-type bacteriocin biosynthesis protein
LAEARVPVCHDDLVAVILAEAPGASRRKAEGLITDLWHHALLLTDLRPPLTSADPAVYVAERLSGLEAAREPLALLRALLDGAAKCDSLSPDEALVSYRNLREQALAINPSASDTPLRVDMAIGLRGNQLKDTVGVEAARAAELLLRMTPYPNGLPWLNAYRRDFAARYGANREVPLVEVLNSHFGLGPPSAYVRPDMNADRESQPASRHGRRNLLLQLACDALRHRRIAIELDDRSLAILETCVPSPSKTPLSLEMYVHVIANSVAALDGGDFRVVVGANVGAREAGRSLGRFAELLGSSAHTALRRSARAVEARAPDVIWAELAYLPRRVRSANVSIRPAIRDYEVVLGVSPGVPQPRVINLDELVIGIRNEQFYLRWSRAEANVVITAGHMLNPRFATDIPRFLSEISEDGRPQLSGFDWGPASGFPFLPRVQVGRIVLHLARWQIDDEVRRRWLDGQDPQRFEQSFHEWRALWQVPKYVYLAQSDNRLLLDLENNDHIAMLHGEILRLRVDRTIVIQEALPALDGAWIEGPAGHYIGEFVVPMIIRGKVTPHERRNESRYLASASAVSAAATAPLPPKSRLHIPGGEWLFAKIYCPGVLEEDLLLDGLSELAQEVVRTGMARDWFFVRYADPDPHLRVRFRGNPADLSGGVLPALSGLVMRLIADGFSSRLVLDTYEREVERYGGEASLSRIEDLFVADSQAVIGLLEVVRGPNPPLDRTALAMLSVDNLLGSLGLSTLEREQWYRDRVATRQETSAVYRQRKAEMLAMLRDPYNAIGEGIGSLVLELLNDRRKAIIPIGIALRELANRGDLSQSLDRVYDSLVHMHCNRLLGIDSMAERYVIGLLSRTSEGLRWLSSQ